MNTDKVCLCDDQAEANCQFGACGPYQIFHLPQKGKSQLSDLLPLETLQCIIYYVCFFNVGLCAFKNGMTGIMSETLVTVKKKSAVKSFFKVLCAHV